MSEIEDQGSFRASRSIPSKLEEGAGASAQALISGEEAERLLRVREAASALLEALRQTVEAIEATDHRHRSNVEETALRAARAAIQSATGA